MTLDIKPNLKLSSYLVSVYLALISLIYFILFFKSTFDYYANPPLILLTEIFLLLLGSLLMFNYVISSVIRLLPLRYNFFIFFTGLIMLIIGYILARWQILDNFIDYRSREYFDIIWNYIPTSVLSLITIIVIIFLITILPRLYQRLKYIFSILAIRSKKNFSQLIITLKNLPKSVKSSKINQLDFHEESLKIIRKDSVNCQKASQKQLKTYVKWIAIFIFILFFIGGISGFFKPNPVIIKQENPEFLPVIELWIKNDSPIPGNIKITINFLDENKNTIDSEIEYIFLNPFEIKKVNIHISSLNTILYTKYYSAHVKAEDLGYFTFVFIILGIAGFFSLAYLMIYGSLTGIAYFLRGYANWRNKRKNQS